MLNPKLELIEDCLERFQELYGSKTADWPEEAKQKARQLLSQGFFELRGEAKRVCEQYADHVNS